jgi:hypothetical protein
MGIRTGKINYSPSRVRVILNKHDLEGLLRMGAPDDEYMGEALAIAERINSLSCPLTIATFTHIILEVWANAFQVSKKEFNSQFKQRVYMVALDMFLDMEKDGK